MSHLALLSQSMDNHRSNSNSNKNSGLVPVDPAALVQELGQSLDVQLTLKKMSSLCLIILDKRLFIDTMTNFIGLTDEPEKVDFTFSTFASKGVLRLTGMGNMSELNEELICLSSMMKLFNGYLLSDCSSLTLVFPMKSFFS